MSELGAAAAATGAAAESAPVQHEADDESVSLDASLRDDAILQPRVVIIRHEFDEMQLNFVELNDLLFLIAAGRRS
jgi:hypothetical protein